MFNPLKYFKNRKVGLALGSGGAKGLAHIAVIEYLEILGIPVDMIAGSSIGAVVGAVHLCGGLPSLKKDMLSFSRREFLSIADITLPKSGLLKGENFIKFLTRYIPRDTKIEDLPKPLSVVATDFYSGKQLVLDKGNLLDAIRASVSIPGVLVPASYSDTFLIDGGVANPLPVDVAKKMGAGLTVAVNLHPGLKISRIMNMAKNSAEKLGIKALHDEMNFAAEGEVINMPELKKESNVWFKSIHHWLARDREKVLYPSIFEVLFQSIDIMEFVNTKNMLRYHRPTILIEPDLLQTGTLDFHHAKKIINAGYDAVSAKRRQILRKIGLWI